ncbi:putative GNAT family N-acyltransferase [Lactobacillus colini]|uniref:GNAT family N-acyltransferase n=1 Tax=Lactobacillus colini TaxID=1819254 RepID=A0ABS4MED7_9LACO|nr:GNAT family N-acetyltransferase [Lactobacillus colini]MBP2058050.1 putative GNAT family N-acyltransferase [Lactobacillus colini]
MNFEFKKIDEMTGQEVFCIFRLRNEVFVAEQKITLPDLDDQDLKAIHVFLLNDERNDALATCRIFQDEHKTWTLGRVVVSKKARGKHLGQKMLEAVHDYLKNEVHAESIFCHAQAYVQDFYANLGYETEGDYFLEGGVKHIGMRKRL